MTRKVKCVVTNEYGMSDTFYRAENGKYYKTEEIFEKYQFENKCRMLLLDKIVDILGYNDTAQFPTTVPKEIKDLHINFEYSVILRTFNKCYKNIQYAISNKKFTSEYGKIKYIFAIVKNSINEVNKDEKNKQLYKVTQQIDENIINNEVSNTKQHKNITEFLEDDG